MTTPQFNVKKLFKLPQSLLIAVVRGYQLLLSPWLGATCRFTPTCSAYALGALAQHGAVSGSYLVVARLARCHPWCEGGHDAVPSHIFAPRLFTRWFEKTTPKSLCAATPPADASSNAILCSTPVSKTLL